MDALYISTTVAIAALAAFLVFISAVKYAVADTFVRTRLIMSAFFVFVVLTLTVSFWHYTVESLWFSIPALALGMLVGYVVDAKIKKLEQWSVINFYSIAGALLVINLLGFSIVVFDSSTSWVLSTCAIGAFLVGTMMPYLIHLWTISPAQNSARITNDQ